MENLERLRIAFKKLKSTVFFDKTQLPLRDQLVIYEADTDFENQLQRLTNALFDGVQWEETEKEILDSIDVLVYPKALMPIDEQTEIFNSDSISITMEKPQYFIDLPPEGHILGALWVLEFGEKLDRNAGDAEKEGGTMYPHSYGNRLRKQLINPKTEDYTYAPGLFEPYFSQYESWRDRALEHAKKRLQDKQDALILTLDFKSFYYSVDIRPEWIEAFPFRFNMTEAWRIRLNWFIYKVIERYSESLRRIHKDNDQLSIENRNVLPIGFLPSAILSNVVLTPFDKAVIEKWNPVYYGRYVDDIMIVDKVEANSRIYQLARSKSKGERLTSATIMNKMFIETGILGSNKSADDDGSIYWIKEDVLDCDGSHITVQNKKVKLFYFQSGATKALLDCFRSKIQHNVSEFRYLPDLDSIMNYRNYSELFQLKNEDSINKLRSVTGIALDKFSLAKFLGKYRKVGGLIQSKEEDAFAEDALLIFDERVLIDNYTTWERLFEIFIVNQRLDIVEKLACKILSAICRFEARVGGDDTHAVYFEKAVPTHDALLCCLHAALCRTLALVWIDKCESLINDLYQEIDRTVKGDHRFQKSTVESFLPAQMNLFRKAYCSTRMVNKYVLPLPIDSVMDQLQFVDRQNINLCRFEDCGLLTRSEWRYRGVYYRYYPYVFSPQEIIFSITYDEIANGQPLPAPNKLLDQTRDLFLSLNYPNHKEDSTVYNLDEIISGAIETLPQSQTEKRRYGTVVGCDEDIALQKLRVAVGNVELNHHNIRRALDRKPERGYRRYSELRRVLNEAIENEVHLLVLPEAYVPFEWIPSLSRVCANNQLALITGVEHIVSRSGEDVPNPNTVYNLTAVILPYKKDDYNFAHVLFHNKVYYSPRERDLIEGYHCKECEGDSYELFCWRDVWFSVYCCYELTSIHDRAIFQTYADLLVAVEWNTDIPYFGNIVESLVRDMHCYCIQANSSDYGDSRLMQPKETEVRDAIRTKGGKNVCILIDEIDIQALREFQSKSIRQQKKDGPFKQTPPDWDRVILEKKRTGMLKEEIGK